MFLGELYPDCVYEIISPVLEIGLHVQEDALCYFVLFCDLCMLTFYEDLYAWPTMTYVCCLMGQAQLFHIISDGFGVLNGLLFFLV